MPDLHDLEAFAGPKFGRSLKDYSDIRTESAYSFAALHRFFRAWNWPAFAWPLAWLMYRRMYLTTAVTVLMILVLWAFVNEFGFYVWLVAPIASRLVFGAFASRTYMCKALRAIGRANSRGLTSSARREFLADTGGISTDSAAGGAILQILLMDGPAILVGFIALIVKVSGFP